MGLNLFSWNWLPLFPILIVYFISGVAETNRHPFDVVEGSLKSWQATWLSIRNGVAVFFLAEYANMILISVLAAILFLGLGCSLDALQFIPGWIWLGLKTFVLFTFFIWFRASFPRYRYDQIMRLGWKIFIPVTLFWLVVVAFWMKVRFQFGVEFNYAKNNWVFKSFLLLELIAGLRVTLSNLFKRKITIQYPEEKTPFHRGSEPTCIEKIS